jgi:hypothetical protein
MTNRLRSREEEGCTVDIAVKALAATADPSACHRRRPHRHDGSDNSRKIVTIGTTHSDDDGTPMMSHGTIRASA